MLPDRVAALQAVPHAIHVAGLHVAGDDAAGRGADAERRALFVRPHHHLERMARLDLRGLHRLDHFERRERAEIAVEVAAGRHRVDVRPEQDRRLIRLTAEAREDVAGRVDARHDVRRP